MSESPQKKRKKTHSHDDHSQKKSAPEEQPIRLEIVQDVGEWSPALGNLKQNYTLPC